MFEVGYNNKENSAKNYHTMTELSCGLANEFGYGIREICDIVIYFNKDNFDGKDYQDNDIYIVYHLNL